MMMEKEMPYDKRHGGPYDRGSADSYYRRPIQPHYYKANTYTSERVEEAQMTGEEIAAYMAGYRENKQEGNFKEW